MVDHVPRRGHATKGLLKCLSILFASTVLSISTFTFVSQISSRQEGKSRDNSPTGFIESSSRQKPTRRELGDVFHQSRTSLGPLLENGKKLWKNRLGGNLGANTSLPPLRVRTTNTLLINAPSALPSHALFRTSATWKLSILTSFLDRWRASNSW